MSISGFVKRRRDKAERAAHCAEMRLSHFVKARFWRGHGVHSPFVYNIIRHVITGRHKDDELRKAARAYRDSLRGDVSRVVVGGMGAVKGVPHQSTVREVAERTSVTDKYGRMLSRLVKELRPKSIVELGTSLGMGAVYLSLGNTNAQVVTLEGLDSVAYAARRHLTEARISNVRVVTGDIDDTLHEVLDSLPDGRVEFAFVDANHSREATLRYFELLTSHKANMCTIVFDDIFWSPGMTDAWRTIVDDERVMTSIELPRMGIVFFRSGCQKEKYVVRW